MHGRLIDADALRFEIINKPSEFKATEATIDFLTGLSKRTHEVLDILDESPTIDAVPVVRCRDCKHWKPTGSKAGNSFSDMEYIGGCEFTNYCRRESDFCSYGERKEGAN